MPLTQTHTFCTHRNTAVWKPRTPANKSIKVYFFFMHNAIISFDSFLFFFSSLYCNPKMINRYVIHLLLTSIVDTHMS